jgi:hypothetical protein
MARDRSTFGDINTSPRNRRLLKWLRRKPQPAVVVGETIDGDEKRAVVSLTGPTQWSDVVSVVRSCVHFDALDDKGATLRSLDLDPDDPELRAEVEGERARAQAAPPVPGSVPIISVDIPRLVDNLARNMREVASESARQQAGAFRSGFEAMTSVVNLCLGLLVRLEQRMADVEDENDAARVAAEQQQQQQTSGQPTSREQLIQLALQKAMSGGNGGGPMNQAGLLQLLAGLQQQMQTAPPEGDPQ